MNVSKTVQSWIVGSLLFLLLVVVGLYGNLQTQFGGVIVDSFLEEDNPARVHDEFAKEKGFHESISIALAFVTRTGKPREFDSKDVNYLIDYHESFQEFLDRQRNYVDQGLPALDADIIGLANYERYVDGVGSKRYVHKDMTDEEIADLKVALILDPAVTDGKMISNDFTSTVITLLVQPGQHEGTIRDSLSSFLQGGKPIGFLQMDLEPVAPPYMEVYPVGWPFARGWFSLISSKDNKKLVALGVILLLFFFWSFTNKSTWHTLVIVFGIYGLSFILLRGSIGVIDSLGIFLIRERVFAELVYGLALVISVSMGTHVWHGYIEARRRGLRVDEAWQEMYGSIGNTIGKAATVALASFALMAVTSTLRPLAEVGLLFVLAVVYPWFLSLLVIPRIFRHQFFIDREPSGSSGVSRTEAFFERVTEVAIRWCSAVRPIGVLAIISILFLVAFITFASGGFLEGSNPDRFLGGTYFQEAAKFMNEEGKSGFNDYQVAFHCTPDEYGEDSDENPQCIQEVLEVIAEVEMLAHVRTSISIPSGAMRQVSTEILAKPHPETQEEVWDVLDALESSSLYMRTRSHFRWSEGYRVIFFSPDPTPVGLGEIETAVFQASSKHKGLEAHPFGSDAMWVELSNETVRLAKRNVPQDLAVLWLLSAFLFWRWRKKMKVMRPVLGLVRTGAVVMIPFFVTTLVMILVMAALGIPLDIASASINQMVIGAAADFLFFPLMAYIKLIEKGYIHEVSMTRSLRETGVAVTGDAFFNCCAFVLLMSSSFIVIKLLGILLVAAVVSTWISTMFFVLPLMKWAHRVRWK